MKTSLIATIGYKFKHFLTFVLATPHMVEWLQQLILKLHITFYTAIKQIYFESKFSCKTWSTKLVREWNLSWEKANMLTWKSHLNPHIGFTQLASRLASQQGMTVAWANDMIRKYYSKIWYLFQNLGSKLGQNQARRFISVSNWIPF